MATRRLLNVLVEPVPGRADGRGGGMFHLRSTDPDMRESYDVRSLSVTGHAVTDDALDDFSARPGKRLRLMVVEEDAPD